MRKKMKEFMEANDFCTEEFDTDQLQTEEKVEAMLKKMEEFVEAYKEEEKELEKIGKLVARDTG